MITAVLVLQIIISIALMVELLTLRKNRIVFEELIVKFVSLGQELFDRIEVHNKKLSDSVNSLSKTSHSIAMIKDTAKILEGSVQDLQASSRVIKAIKIKEFKDIEEGIKKIKSLIK